MTWREIKKSDNRWCSSNIARPIGALYGAGHRAELGVVHPGILRYQRKRDMPNRILIEFSGSLGLAVPALEMWW